MIKDITGNVYNKAHAWVVKKKKKSCLSWVMGGVHSAGMMSCLLCFEGGTDCGLTPRAPLEGCLSHCFRTKISYLTEAGGDPDDPWTHLHCSPNNYMSCHIWMLTWNNVWPIGKKGVIFWYLRAIQILIDVLCITEKIVYWKKENLPCQYLF